MKHAGLPLFIMATLLMVFMPNESQSFISCSIFPARDQQGLNWLTGHFCHSSMQHWALNATGLGIFALLYGHRFSAIQFTLLVFCLIIGTNLYLYFFYPLDFYLGLSSILYGLFLFSALTYFPRERALSTFVVLSLTAQGAASYLAFYTWSTTDLPTAADVHLASATISALIYVAWRGWRKWR